MAKYKKRKDGRYAAWVTTDEINPENGKRVRIQVYGRSVAELERKKAEVIEQTSKGIYVSEKNVIGESLTIQILNCYSDEVTQVNNIKEKLYQQLAIDYGNSAAKGRYAGTDKRFAK